MPDVGVGSGDLSGWRCIERKAQPKTDSTECDGNRHDKSPDGIPIHGRSEPHERGGDRTRKPPADDPDPARLLLC